MLISFTPYGDEFVIYAETLTPGDIVNVTTRGGKSVEVIVGDILEENEDGVLARFEYVNEIEINPDLTVFTRRGDEWLVRGRDLVPGDIVTVHHKEDERTSEVMITEIFEDVGGLCYARFEQDQPEGPYFHRLNAKTWVVRGKSLKVGDEREVTTKSGDVKRVRITTIISENTDGAADAFFEWID